jgi:hypothetical protein
MNELPELLNGVTDRTRDVIRLSAAFSMQFLHSDIAPEDLVDALAHKGGISDLALAESGYVRKERPKPIPEADHIIGRSATLKVIMTDARELARLLGHDYVGTEHLLLTLARTNPDLLHDPAQARRSVLRILGHAR